MAFLFWYISMYFVQDQTLSNESPCRTRFRVYKTCHADEVKDIWTSQGNSVHLVFQGCSQLGHATLGPLKQSRVKKQARNYTSEHYSQEKMSSISGKYRW